MTQTLLLRAGMWLYDGLSFDKSRVVEVKNRLAGHRLYTAAEVQRRVPLLQSAQLRGGVCYFDYANVNPDRMTLAFLGAAQDNGVQLANYAKVTRLLRRENAIHGVEVLDQITQRQCVFKAPWTVNCAGPWVAQVVGGALGTPPPRQVRSEGVHLITNKFRCDAAVVLPTREGEHLMLLPWRGLTIIGPTDRAYIGDVDHYAASRESVDELIDRMNSYIPAEAMGGRFGRQDILFHYGGLRPLVGDHLAGDTYRASRRYEIIDHGRRDGLAGLISVAGGKYTTSRGLAERTLAHIAPIAGWQVNRQDSARFVLPACRVGDFDAFLGRLAAEYGSHYPSSTIEYYARNFGVEAEQVLSLGLQTDEGTRQVTADGEILAEVDYVLERELVFEIDDLLLRRTGIGWMGRPPDKLLQLVADRLGDRRGWSLQQRQHARDRYLERYCTLP